MDRYNPFRVIVCGGRNYTDQSRVFTTLDKIDQERGHITMIVHGNASGADALGRHWAGLRNRKHWPFPTEWSKHGKGAGPIRNKAMLGSGASLVVAFPTSGAENKGTKNMVAQARRAGLEVIEVKP